MAFTKTLNWLHRLENAVLTVLVLVLVALAGAQIFMRNAFGGGLSWADPFLRTLVVWTAMLGALAAVREDKHIAVDVLQRFLPPGAQRAARVLTLLFAAGICAALACYGWGLVSVDLDGGARSDFGLPNWLLESILPIGFGLMAVRFVLRAFAAPTHVPGLSAPELLHDAGRAHAGDEGQAR
ncbi:MAG: TRAP transporter small permease [Rudaea sp.]|uniref:TRAP transporter small permease n=1 Tax=Rudaea sp. TaxID=2136325 RepID=UPI0039E61504